MPRFVVLEHDWPFPHWDFMLEDGPTLRAWRLLEAPGPFEDVPAEPITRHRLAYLDYEGPVSSNRGTVRRMDDGTFDWVGETEARVEVMLAGRLLVGRCTVDGGRWRLVPAG
jgi:hypothetical protein